MMASALCSPIAAVIKCAPCSLSQTPPSSPALRSPGHPGQPSLHPADVKAASQYCRKQGKFLPALGQPLLLFLAALALECQNAEQSSLMLYIPILSTPHPTHITVHIACQRLVPPNINAPHAKIASCTHVLAVLSNRAKS